MILSEACWDSIISDAPADPLPFIPEEKGPVRDACEAIQKRHVFQEPLPFSICALPEFLEISVRVLLWGTPKDAEVYATECSIHRNGPSMFVHELALLTRRDDPEVCVAVFRHLSTFHINMFPEVFAPRANNSIEVFSPLISWKGCDFDEVIKKIVDRDSEKALLHVLQKKIFIGSFKEFLDIFPERRFPIRPRTFRLIRKRWRLSKKDVFGSMEEYLRVLRKSQSREFRNPDLEKLLQEIPD